MFVLLNPFDCHSENVHRGPELRWSVHVSEGRIWVRASSVPFRKMPSIIFLFVCCHLVFEIITWFLGHQALAKIRPIFSVAFFRQSCLCITATGRIWWHRKLRGALQLIINRKFNGLVCVLFVILSQLISVLYFSVQMILLCRLSQEGRGGWGFPVEFS